MDVTGIELGVRLIAELFFIGWLTISTITIYRLVVPTKRKFIYHDHNRKVWPGSTPSWWNEDGTLSKKTGYKIPEIVENYEDEPTEPPY